MNDTTFDIQVSPYIRDGKRVSGYTRRVNPKRLADTLWRVQRREDQAQARPNTPKRPLIQAFEAINGLADRLERLAGMTERQGRSVPQKELNTLYGMLRAALSGARKMAMSAGTTAEMDAANALVDFLEGLDDQFQQEMTRLRRKASPASSEGSRRIERGLRATMPGDDDLGDLLEKFVVGAKRAGVSVGRKLGVNDWASRKYVISERVPSR